METTGKHRSSVAGGSDDFRNFLGYLEETGACKDKENCEPEVWASAIGSKFEGKQAVLFEKVEGSKMSVVCNVLGTRNRFCLGLG